MNRLKRSTLRIVVALMMSVLLAESAFAYDAIELEYDTPDITAKAAVVYSSDLDKVVYTKNADKKLNPYSITKLMTAYVTCEHLSMDQVITVKGVKADLEESKMDLVEGEKLTVRQLVEGLLVESGNDAARLLAITVSGSEKDFVELMNEQAAAWGCTNTHFANASGMQDKNHYTTANDYLEIAKHVFENEDIREICAAKKVTIPATSKSKKRVYKNHTTLISDADSGVVGGKTGYWNEDDCSVVLQYYKKDLAATMVILGDTKKGREADVKKLSKIAHGTIPGYVVAKPKAEADKLWIKGGEITHVPVYVKEKSYAYPKDGKESEINIKTTLNKGVQAPLKKNQVIGKYMVYVDGELRATHDLVVREKVDEGWFPSKVYISNRATLIIAAVIVSLIVLRTLLRAMILRRRAKKRKKAARGYQAKH